MAEWVPGLAASIDIIGVALGGILGHVICTGAAVLGGRQLATHIQERTVLVSGGSHAQCFNSYVWAYCQLCSGCAQRGKAYLLVRQAELGFKVATANAVEGLAYYLTYHHARICYSIC